MNQERSGARQLLGIEIVHVGEGTAIARMVVIDSVLNDHGTCHGGVIFTLADAALERACNSHGPLTVAASASIEFVGAARAGSTLTATATETFRGARSGIYDIVVHDDEGTVIAHFRGRSRTLDR